jgi:hypothetical protein
MTEPATTTEAEDFTEDLSDEALDREEAGTRSCSCTSPRPSCRDRDV